MAVIPVIESGLRSTVGPCDISVKTVGDVARVTIDFDSPLNHDSHRDLRRLLHEALAPYMKGDVLEVVPNKTLMVVLRII